MKKLVKKSFFIAIVVTLINFSSIFAKAQVNKNSPELKNKSTEQNLSQNQIQKSSLLPEQNFGEDFIQLEENVFYYTLQNGLSVFIAEDHSVPLSYVEIAVRAGAITQNPKNAGLFHLYEHLMFKGNKKFTDAAKVQKALTDMGTGNWNGTTGIECVNYYFTIPASQIENGLDFWNNAIRFPLMDEREFESEKKVVISEIQGQVSDPDRFVGAFINNQLYEKSWQLDPSGSVKNIQNATISDLREIQNKFYVPENAALFIGGDVEHKKIIELVKNIYGDWQNNDINIEESLQKIESSKEFQEKNPFNAPLFCVVPYDKIPENSARINVFYRGPDFDLNEDDTITADFFSFYMNNPQSDFLNHFVKNPRFAIPSEQYIGTGYSTRRRTGLISFSAMMNLEKIELAKNDFSQNSKNNFASIFVDFKNSLDEYFNQILNRKKIVDERNRKKIIQQLRDDKILDAQTFSGMLSTLRYNWTTTNLDYYKNYILRVQATSDDDIKSYIKKYFVEKNPLVLVFVNPKVYDAHKDDFESFKLVSQDSNDIFWWQK